MKTLELIEKSQKRGYTYKITNISAAKCPTVAKYGTNLMSRHDTFAEWVDILTDFKNATPRLNLNIFWIKTA